MHSFSQFPWHPTDIAGREYLVFSHDGKLVANCSGHFTRTAAEQIANAILVASAPDLLDNLKNLCNVFGQGLDPVKNECAYRAIANARAAIAKAEGGEA
jgi:hypothetical protein